MDTIRIAQTIGITAAGFCAGTLRSFHLFPKAFPHSLFLNLQDALHFLPLQLPDG